MKIILVFLFSIVLIASVPFSFAQNTANLSETNIPKVMLQLELRNSDGILLTYIEATKIVSMDTTLLNEFLDDKPSKLLVKDDKVYEIIKWLGRVETFDKEHAYSLFDLWIPVQNNYESGLAIIHNSYQTKPGDTLTVYWTIIRPVN